MQSKLVVILGLVRSSFVPPNTRLKNFGFKNWQLLLWEPQLGCYELSHSVYSIINLKVKQKITLLGRKHENHGNRMILRLRLIRVKAFPENIPFFGNAIFWKGKCFHVFGCISKNVSKNIFWCLVVFLKIP